MRGVKDLEKHCISLSKLLKILAVIVLLLAPVAFINPQPVKASAIVFDSVGSSNNGGGSDKVSYLQNISADADIIVIGVAIKNVSITVLSATVNGTSTIILRADNLVTYVRLETWFITHPPTGSNLNITVTLSGTSKATAGSTTYSGVSGIWDYSAGGGNSAYPHCNITTSTTGQLVWMNFAWANIYTVSSHDSGQTHRWHETTTGGLALSRVSGHGDDIIETDVGAQTYQITKSGSGYWLSHCFLLTGDTETTTTTSTITTTTTTTTNTSPFISLYSGSTMLWPIITFLALGLLIIVWAGIKRH